MNQLKMKPQITLETYQTDLANDEHLTRMDIVIRHDLDCKKVEAILRLALDDVMRVLKCLQQ